MNLITTLEISYSSSKLNLVVFYSFIVFAIVMIACTAKGSWIYSLLSLSTNNFNMFLLTFDLILLGKYEINCKNGSIDTISDKSSEFTKILTKNYSNLLKISKSAWELLVTSN